MEITWTEQETQREYAERFVHSVVKITRLYDYQTWQTFFEKLTRCAKVCGLFILIVLFWCWLAGQTNYDTKDMKNDHMIYWEEKRKRDTCILIRTWLAKMLGYAKNYAVGWEANLIGQLLTHSCCRCCFTRNVFNCVTATNQRSPSWKQGSSRHR